jgi:hypothetical protein
LAQSDLLYGISFIRVDQRIGWIIAMNESDAKKAWTAVLTRSTGLSPTNAVTE